MEKAAKIMIIDSLTLHHSYKSDALKTTTMVHFASKKQPLKVALLRVK